MIERVIHFLVYLKTIPLVSSYLPTNPRNEQDDLSQNAVDQWFCPRVILPPRGHPSMPGDSFGCPNPESTMLLASLTEARDAVKTPTIHKTDISI